MNFMDFYIIDPLETCQESAIYVGLTHYDIEIANEGLVKGTEVGLDDIKKFFQSEKRFFTRRSFTLGVKLGLLKGRLGGVISTEKYKALSKAMPMMMKYYQNLARIKGESDIKVDGAMRAGKEELNKMLENLIPSDAKSRDKMQDITSSEASKIITQLKDINKRLAKDASDLEKETVKVNRMSDNDPKKEEAVKALKMKRDEMSKVHKLVSFCDSTADSIRLNNASQNAAFSQQMKMAHDQMKMAHDMAHSDAMRAHAAGVNANHMAMGIGPVM